MIIKPDLAIARVFTAIIYADGYLSQQELQFLEENIKPKYHLSALNFQQLGKCSFAQAIHTILAYSGEQWLKKINQTPQSIIDDMVRMSQCDGQITPRESLICLCTRLAFETGFCDIISCEEENLRFSKSDIIYIESNYNEEINDDIIKNYDNIRYILNNFGYNFIYIPKIKEEFIQYSDSFRRHLLQFLFPDNHKQAELDEMLLTRLPSSTTSGFSNMLMEPFGSDLNYEPSLVIKLPTKHGLSPNGQWDFLLLKIHGNVLETIQAFFQKYNALAGCNFVQVKNGISNNTFICRGIHRTFVDYLSNSITDIQIHLHKDTLIHFGTVGQIKLSSRLLATYLTILYFTIKQGALYREWNRLDEQYEIFHKIYFHFRKYNEYEKDDFYTSIQSDFSKVVGKFKEHSNKYLQKMAPLYNNKNFSMQCPLVPIVQVVKYSSVAKDPFPIDFVEWIENL